MLSPDLNNEWNHTFVAHGLWTLAELWYPLRLPNLTSQKKSAMGFAVAPAPGQVANPRASQTVRSKFWWW